MKILPLIGPLAVLAISLGITGCALHQFYKISPEKGTKYRISAAQDASTSIRKDAVVTVGPTVKSQVYRFSFAVLITNTSRKNLATSFDTVKIRVNGKPVPIYNLKNIKSKARLERYAIGLNAASASMARSTAAGYGVSDQKYNRNRRDYGQIMYETVTKINLDRRRMLNHEARKLSNIQNKSWLQTKTLRAHLSSRINFTLIKDYYWRDEVIKPGQQALRVLWINEKDKSVASSPTSKIEIEFKLGKRKYVFPFNAVAQVKSK
ncbi:MAG: hypothetical protein V3R65_04450 [Acidiferrobacterales bacterium]